MQYEHDLHERQWERIDKLEREMRQLTNAMNLLISALNRGVIPVVHSVELIPLEPK